MDCAVIRTECRVMSTFERKTAGRVGVIQKQAAQRCPDLPRIKNHQKTPASRRRNGKNSGGALSSPCITWLVTQKPSRPTYEDIRPESDLSSAVKSSIYVRWKVIRRKSGGRGRVLHPLSYSSPVTSWIMGKNASWQRINKHSTANFRLHVFATKATLWMTVGSRSVSRLCVCDPKWPEIERCGSFPRGHS